MLKMLNSIDDHNDEVAAALCCCFSPDGQQIYSGFDRAVRIFQTSRPGRDSQTRKTTPTRSSRKGQKGLISTLSVTPDGTMYAAGSYSGSIGVYSCAEGKELALLPAGSGVTQVSFAPDGLLLMAGERKSSALAGWDIRHTAAPLFTCRRALTTNQRLQFDIDPCSSYVATADETGKVLVYDIREECDKPEDSPAVAGEFALHEDVCCNSVAFHPYLPVLATGSGSRQFTEEGEAPQSRNEVGVHKLGWERGPEAEAEDLADLSH